jgi:hypothetical protein
MQDVPVLAHVRSKELDNIAESDYQMSIGAARRDRAEGDHSDAVAAGRGHRPVTQQRVDQMMNVAYRAAAKPSQRMKHERISRCLIELYDPPFNFANEHVAFISIDH